MNLDGDLQVEPMVKSGRTLQQVIDAKPLREFDEEWGKFRKPEPSSRSFYNGWLRRRSQGASGASGRAGEVAALLELGKAHRQHLPRASFPSADFSTSISCCLSGIPVGITILPPGLSCARSGGGISPARR